MLLEHSVNVNISHINGRTALIQASQNGHTDVVKLLLKHKANVNATDENGLTALDMAIVNDHTETARVLESGGAISHFTDANRIDAMAEVTPFPSIDGSKEFNVRSVGRWAHTKHESYIDETCKTLMVPGLHPVVRHGTHFTNQPE